MRLTVKHVNSPIGIHETIPVTEVVHVCYKIGSLSLNSGKSIEMYLNTCSKTVHDLPLEELFFEYSICPHGSHS